MPRTVLKILPVLALLLTAGTARAVAVALDSGNGPSYLRVFASDEIGEAGFSTLPAGEPPFTDSDTIQDGAATATSTYDLSNDHFTITFDHTRPADPLNSHALSTGRVFFTVDTDVDFVLSGSYAATDLEGRETFFEGRLFEQEIDCCVFHPVAISTQESHATVNESFVLGGSGGDFSNTTQGALFGTLTAGRVYWFSYQAYVRATPEPSSQPASATGSITLAFVPEPSTALLLGGGLLALGLRRRRRSR